MDRKPQTYVVRGHWPFPTDMLRHDGSQAATPADQDMIDSLSQEHAPDRAAFKDVDISLVGPRKPNTARWESFGWAVPGDAEHAFIKREAVERAERRKLAEGALARCSDAERAALATYFFRAENI